MLDYTISFWEIISEPFNRMIRKLYPLYSPYRRKKPKYYYRYQIGFLLVFIVICILFPVIILDKSFLLTDYSDILETNDIYKSSVFSADESLLPNIHNRSIRHLYIDVGCYNGETIEHFIHFAPNSSLYDIITFEPDPFNYKLCQKRLSQEKYKAFNIVIIPKVVWIRNEKVFYRIFQGQKSRIDFSETNASNLAQLDAIDFSSWLSQFIKPNRTRLRLKISMPGAELRLLRKMVADGTAALPFQWDIEYSETSNPRTLPVYVYLQLMLDSYGFDNCCATLLQDKRKVFKANLSYPHVKQYKYPEIVPDMDAYTHYYQRVDKIVPMFKRKANKRLSKL